VGFLIGAVTGGLQFWLLARFTRAITDGGLDTGAVLIGAGQFFLPLVVLLAVAAFVREWLLAAALGMAAALIGSALVRYIAAQKRARGK
ncbi:MAG: hypothetical protein LBC21_05125, partial [Oscillospiraceae bacterium]|nr:hypothetical protein [Oscillospiraceae bacterium]